MDFIDVSSYMYAGMTNNFGSKASYNGVPTGGIYLLLLKIAASIKYNETCVLLFDSPTNAREILPEYKGSRSRNPKVRFQGDMCYKYLKPVVANCFKIPGYEADWLGFNVAEKARKNPDILGMTFRTVDYDWCHNIVTKYDTMVPAAKGYMEVYSANFEKSFSGVNFRVPLNSISAKKVFFGDSSDNIEPFNGAMSNEDLMNTFIQYCKVNNLDPRELDSMYEYIDKFGDILGDTEYLKRRAYIIYPRKMKDTSSLEISYTPIEAKNLSKICSLFGCRSIADKLGITYYEDMGDLAKEIKREYQESYMYNKTELFQQKLEERGAKKTDLPERGGFII